MRRSSYRRAATRRGSDRRLLAVAAVLVAIGGAIGITSISSAAENDLAACTATAATEKAATGDDAATDPDVGTYKDANGVTQHKGDGQEDDGATKEAAENCQDGNSVKVNVNGLEILTNTCDTSTLEPHDGFQKGNRCVSTEFGEVGNAANNPSLLITRAPTAVGVGEAFTLEVSTRNLIRDRFLAAGQGGYYVESSVLQNGLVRGHFHTACRMLTSTDEAPDPAPVPAFFVATEDNKGSATPDTVTIQVPGLPQEGLAQCASWAGDGSHRIPMMERANQTPSIDAVRIQVGAGGGDQGDDNGDDAGNGNADDDADTGNNGGDNGNNAGGNNGNNNGGGNNAGGGNNNNGGGNQGDTNAGDTDGGKAPTVTIPPTTAPDTGDEEADAPATTKPATKAPDSSDDSDSDADSSDSDDAAAATPEATKSTKAANAAADTSDSDDDSADEEKTTYTDDGAPDPDQDTDTVAQDVPAATSGESLALTGANVTAVLFIGAGLVLGGLILLRSTRRPQGTE